MIEFNPQELRLLQSIGRSEDGRDLANLLRNAKEKLSSVNSIDSSKDYGAQVEGRKLFGDFIDQIVLAIETKKHKINPKAPEDYE